MTTQATTKDIENLLDEDYKETMTAKIKVNTDANEFKIVSNVKDEPTLKEAQAFVGGMVEGISFPNGDYLIVNEEGKLMQLPLNPEGTALWRATFTKETHINGYDDWVCGPAILIKHKALKLWK